MNETLLLIVIAVLIYFNKNKTASDGATKASTDSTKWSEKLSKDAKLVTFAILDSGIFDLLQDGKSILQWKFEAFPKIELTQLTDPSDSKKIVGYEIKTSDTSSDSFNSLTTIIYKVKNLTGPNTKFELVTSKETPLEENYYLQKALLDEKITFTAKTTDNSPIYALDNAKNQMMAQATTQGQNQVIVGQEVSLTTGFPAVNGGSQNLLSNLGFTEAQIQALLQAPSASAGLLPSPGALPAESQATLQARAFKLSDEIQPIVVQAIQIATASGNAQALAIANQSKAMAQKTVDATFAGNYGGAIELGFQTKLLAQQAIDLAMLA